MMDRGLAFVQEDAALDGQRPSLAKVKSSFKNPSVGRLSPKANRNGIDRNDTKEPKGKIVTAQD